MNKIEHREHTKPSEPIKIRRVKPAFIFNNQQKTALSKTVYCGFRPVSWITFEWEAWWKSNTKIQLMFLPFLCSLHAIQQLQHKEKDKKMNSFTIPALGLCD